MRQPDAPVEHVGVGALRHSDRDARVGRDARVAFDDARRAPPSRSRTNCASCSGAKCASTHAHCNRKALIGQRSGAWLIEAAGLDGEVLDSGCCGMAGAFCYARRKYDVSMRLGELVLLPRVRQASGDVMIVADGYSCREQIAHGCGRAALHPAQVLAMAIEAR